MQRDWFRRPQRFSFAFGSLETAQDPIGGCFELPYPKRFDEHTSHPICVQHDGEQRFFARPARSAIETPGGRLASIEGPRPDRAADIGYAMPVAVVGRKIGPGR